MAARLNAPIRLPNAIRTCIRIAKGFDSLCGSIAARNLPGRPWRASAPSGSGQRDWWVPDACLRSLDDRITLFIEIASCFKKQKDADDDGVILLWGQNKNGLAVRCYRRQTK